MKTPYFEKKTKSVFTTYKNVSYDYSAHFHTFIEVIYCFSGEQIVIINGETYTLKKGDIAFVSPCVLHEYKKRESGKATTISIMCETEFLSILFPQIINSIVSNPVINCCEVEELFDLISISKDRNEIVGYLTVILSKVVSLFNFKDTYSEKSGDIIKSLCLFVEENYSENLSIEALSKKFGYSKSYIAHLFSEKLKIPFRNYLNGIRCEKAYLLLKRKEKRVTEIASEVGFLSINTFTRCFTKIYKQTPSQIKNSRN